MTKFTAKYPDGLTRCSWPGTDPVYLDYHDSEWGVLVEDDRMLFEAISLEGFQAGLSWITILKRREAFRKAFQNFEVTKVASMNATDVEQLMKNTGIIRNRAKIISTINNAKITNQLARSLSEIIWDFRPKTNNASARFRVLTESPESKALSKELKSLGFSFVGPTTMYAMMQSIGMVNDHAPGCYRKEQLRD
jgi:DNA-3-methyladenine glycosylase I